jgi:hypothetical protein
MQRRAFYRAIILALILSGVTNAQSRAYAKFGAGGETVGLYNLVREPARCDLWQVFDGLVATVSSRKRATDIEHRFALDGSVGQRVFQFSLRADDISQPDVRSLIFKRQRVRVRACRRAGYWEAEEVTRGNSR